MNAPVRYREIEVSGTPAQMGEQLGEEAREKIRGFSAVALERVNKTVAVSRESALVAAGESIEPVRTYSPGMLDEIEGMARSSGVSVPELLLLQIRNQLRPDGDSGCTAFSLSPAVATGSIVGQNWDNDPALDPFTIVLTRRPTGEPAFLSVTQAGLIAYIGVSEAGIGLCMNTLPAPSGDAGVPLYFAIRGIYQATGLAGAAEAVRRARRPIAINALLATPDGPADLEITIDSVHVLADPGTGIVTHTNHCLHPELVHHNESFPELIQSGPRLRRIDALLKEAPKPLTVPVLQDMLRDHHGHPTSICRHANDHPENGFWTSVFSVVIEADAGVMHLSRGFICGSPFESFAMN